MSNCKVAEVTYCEYSPRPFICSFQNGKLQEGNNLDCSLYKDNNKFVPVLASDNILYTEKIDRNDDVFNNMLVIRNKKTNKVRLVAIDNVILKPQMLKTTEILNKTVDERKHYAIQELNKTFGSKRAKRQTEQMERMKIDVEGMREQLETTIADVKVDIKDLEAPDSAITSDFLPKVNSDASIRENVYPLDSFIPDHILHALTAEAERVLAAKEEDINCSEFVKAEILKLQGSPLESRLQDTQILLYIDCLIAMIITNAKVISKHNFVICSYSQEVDKFILNNFTINGDRGRTRSLSMRDKSVCTLLVLMMIFRKYHINYMDVSKSTKLGVLKLQELGKLLRFTATTKDKNLVMLKLPLPPIPSRSPRKNKKR